MLFRITIACLSAASLFSQTPAERQDYLAKVEKHSKAPEVQSWARNQTPPTADLTAFANAVTRAAHAMELG